MARQRREGSPARRNDRRTGRSSGHDPGQRVGVREAHRRAHRRDWLRRTLVGSALGLVTGSAIGCYLHDEEDFVVEYAVEVCRMVRDCGRSLHLPGETDTLPATSACEDLVEAHYSTCTSSCDYRPSKARRCLRRLRDNECGKVVTGGGPNDEDKGDETIPLVCDDVFEQCEGGEDQAQLCNSPSGCAVGGRPGEGSWLALGLLVLGLGARRRWSRGAGAGRATAA